jgi:hypothetical protein
VPAKFTETGQNLAILAGQTAHFSGRSLLVA